jgi:hypothetical protein
MIGPLIPGDRSTGEKTVPKHAWVEGGTQTIVVGKRAISLRSI